MREWRSVRELSDKQKKKTKKTLDTAGVVRDGRLCPSSVRNCSQARTCLDRGGIGGLGCEPTSGLSNPTKVERMTGALLDERANRARSAFPEGATLLLRRPDGLDSGRNKCGRPLRSDYRAGCTGEDA